MCVSVLRSYLARIGLQERSSARLENWWPRTRTSLGLFPRCCQSVRLLQKEKKQERKQMFSRACRKYISFTLYPLPPSPRYCWYFSVEKYLTLWCPLLFIKILVLLLYLWGTLWKSHTFMQLYFIFIFHKRDTFSPTDYPHSPTKRQCVHNSEIPSKKFAKSKTSLKITFYKLRWHFRGLLLCSSLQAWDPSPAADSLPWRKPVSILAANWQQLHSSTPEHRPDGAL